MSLMSKDLFISVPLYGGGLSGFPLCDALGDDLCLVVSTKETYTCII